MKKQIFLTGMLTLALLTPVSEAQAQGWPTFDVAKLASLITNLIGRFQPVPQVLSRVNQVKSTISQVQAVGQAALSGDLKALGKAAAAGLQLDSFTNGRSQSPVEASAKGANGAKDAMKAVKNSLFNLKENATTEERKEINVVRREYQAAVSSEVLAKAFYMAMNAGKQSAERFKKADEAMKNAETVQDSVNANTLMIMAGNYERLNQISLELSKMKKELVGRVNSMPSGGFAKPAPIKDLEMGAGKYTEEEKDEIDVDY